MDLSFELGIFLGFILGVSSIIIFLYLEDLAGFRDFIDSEQNNKTVWKRILSIYNAFKNVVGNIPKYISNLI